MFKNISHRIREAGPWGFGIFVSTCVLATIFLFYARVPGAVGLPEPSGEVKVVPALGLEGYSGTLEFCKDLATKVKSLMIPDAKAFELTRLKDGKSESIAISLDMNNDVTYATYSTDGLTPVPAQVSEESKKCLQDRTK